jgi:hypothetical protein
VKFYPLKTPAAGETPLAAEYKDGREIGVIRLGAGHLFFRKMRKIYYISYPEIRQCFRRVQLIPTKCCCGKGDFQVENLVISDGEQELAMIQLPGTRAAEALMEEMRARAPHAKLSNI